MASEKNMLDIGSKFIWKNDYDVGNICINKIKKVNKSFVEIQLMKRQKKIY